MKPKISFSANSELSREEVQALAPTVKPVIAKRSRPASISSTPIQPTKEVTVEEIMGISLPVDMPDLNEEEQARLDILNELATAKAKREQAQTKPISAGKDANPQGLANMPAPPTPAPEPEEDDDFDDGLILPDDDDWNDDGDNDDLFEDEAENDFEHDDEEDNEPLLKAAAVAVTDAETTAKLVYQVYGDSGQYAAALRFVKAMQAVNLAVRDFIAAHHKE